MTDTRNWKMKDGQIALCPIIKYELFGAYEMGVALRIEFARTEQQLKSGKLDAEQFVLTPREVERFAKALLEAAETLQQPPAMGTLRN